MKIQAEADAIRVERHGAVVVCTITRPHRGNSLRSIDAARLADVVEGLSRDRVARAVLVRSDGTHFCTGADLSAHDTGAARHPRPPTGHMRQGLAGAAHRLILALWRCRVPVVAAVQGRAQGLGCHLAAACDITVAAASARFCEPFAHRGFSVDSGGSWLLPRRVGLTRAMAMLLRGVEVDAATALDWGLVTMVVPDGDLDQTARELAAELAHGPTLALSLTKGLVNRHAGGEGTLEAALEDEAMAVELSIRSPDFREGMQAFAERRSPLFRGD